RQSGIAPEKLRGVLRDLYANDPIVRGTTFRKKLPTVWGVWEKSDDEQLEARVVRLRKERNQLLDLKTDLELRGKSLTDEQTRRLKEVSLERDGGALERDLRY